MDSNIEPIVAMKSKSAAKTVDEKNRVNIIK